VPKDLKTSTPDAERTRLLGHLCQRAKGFIDHPFEMCESIHDEVWHKPRATAAHNNTITPCLWRFCKEMRATQGAPTAAYWTYDEEVKRRISTQIRRSAYEDIHLGFQ